MRFRCSFRDVFFALLGRKTEMVYVMIKKTINNKTFTARSGQFGYGIKRT